MSSQEAAPVAPDEPPRPRVVGGTWASYRSLQAARDLRPTSLHGLQRQASTKPYRQARILVRTPGSTKPGDQSLPLYPHETDLAMARDVAELWRALDTHADHAGYTPGNAKFNLRAPYALDADLCAKLRSLPDFHTFKAFLADELLPPPRFERPRLSGAKRSRQQSEGERRSGRPRTYSTAPGMWSKKLTADNMKNNRLIIPDLAMRGEAFDSWQPSAEQPRPTLLLTYTDAAGVEHQGVDAGLGSLTGDGYRLGKPTMDILEGLGAGLGDTVALHLIRREGHTIRARLELQRAAPAAAAGGALHPGSAAATAAQPPAAAAEAHSVGSLSEDHYDSDDDSIEAVEMDSQGGQQQQQQQQQQQPDQQQQPQQGEPQPQGGTADPRLSSSPLPQPAASSAGSQRAPRPRTFTTAPGRFSKTLTADNIRNARVIIPPKAMTSVAFGSWQPDEDHPQPTILFTFTGAGGVEFEDVDAASRLCSDGHHMGKPVLEALQELGAAEGDAVVLRLIERKGHTIRVRLGLQKAAARGGTAAAAGPPQPLEAAAAARAATPVPASMPDVQPSLQQSPKQSAEQQQQPPEQQQQQQQQQQQPPPLAAVTPREEQEQQDRLALADVQHDPTRGDEYLPPGQPSHTALGRAFNTTLGGPAVRPDAAEAAEPAGEAKQQPAKPEPAASRPGGGAPAAAAADGAAATDAAREAGPAAPVAAAGFDLAQLGAVDTSKRNAMAAAVRKLLAQTGLTADEQQDCMAFFMMCSLDDMQFHFEQLCFHYGRGETAQMERWARKRMAG